MSPGDSQSDIPGQLVETSGVEHLARDGRVEPVRFRGLAFLPDPLPPPIPAKELIGEVWQSLDAATRGLARLEGTARTLPNEDLLANPFSIREAQASSRIENTIATAEEIGLVAEDEAPRDESREVRNYLTALEQGLASEAPLGAWLLRSMHRTLMTGVRGEDKFPGDYRATQAYIGGDHPGFDNARFVPPPADRIQLCMDDLDRFIASPPDDLPPLIAIAMAHYQFEAIHPFADGNGRVGRLLISVSLCRYRLIERPLVYPSSFFDAHRSDYYRLLRRVSTHNEWTPWIRFFCQAIETQAEDAIRRAARLLELRKSYIDRVTGKWSPALLRELTDFLFTRPVVRASSVAQRLGVQPQQAQRYIDRLVEHGILTEVTGRSYGRIYAARGILEAIEIDT